MRKTAARIAEVTLFLLVSFLLYYSVSFVPYYVAWDMDLMTVMDILEIQNGNVPIHINHTGLGLYLILFATIKISSLLNLLSIYNYSELMSSWNSLFTLAEFTYWLKFLNSFILMGIFAFSYLGAKNFLKEKGHSTHLLGLIAILTTASLWNFQLYLVRTELYSIFFFSIAFYFLSTMKENNLKSLLGLGVFLGLGFITKFQGFFVFLSMIIMCTWNPETKYFTVSKTLKWTLLSCFIAVTVLSRMAYLPGHFAEFARGYFPNLFFIVVLGIIVLSLYLHRPGKMIGRFVISPWFYSVSNQWIILITSILLCFLFTFVFYSDPSTGFEYMLYLWRMIFLKLSRDFSYANPHPNTLSLIIWTIKYFAPTLLALILVIFKSKKNGRLLLLSLLMGASLVAAHRGTEQDAIWNELLLIWLIFFLAKDLAPKWLLLCFSLVIINNLKNVEQRGFLSHKPIGHMAIKEFLKEPYENPYMLYSETIQKNYSLELQNQSLLLARNHIQLRSQQSILWAEPELKLDRLNLIEKGAKIGLDISIKSFSESLKGQLISGTNENIQQAEIRINDLNQYALLSEAQDVRSSDCLLTKTELFIKTDKDLKLQLIKIQRQPDRPFSPLQSCHLELTHPKPLYIVAI